jgi:hypothetical protein
MGGCTGGPVYLRWWSLVQRSWDKTWRCCSYLWPWLLRLHRLLEQSLLFEARKRSQPLIETRKRPTKSMLYRSKVCTCVNRNMCPFHFFPLGFWDGVFSEAHMSRLQRTFLATGVWIVDRSLLTGAAIWSRCAS